MKIVNEEPAQHQGVSCLGLGITFSPVLLTIGHFGWPENQVLKHITNGAVLLVGALMLSGIADPSAKFGSLPLIWILLVLVGGIISFVFFGWAGTFGVLGAYGVFCLISRFLER